MRVIPLQKKQNQHIQVGYRTRDTAFEIKHVDEETMKSVKHFYAPWILQT